jgi:hypothetical protein
MPKILIIPQSQKVYSVSAADEAMEQNKAPPKSEALPRRETMKIMLLAAAAALSLGVSAAYADGGQGTLPNTYFTSFLA